MKAQFGLSSSITGGVPDENGEYLMFVDFPEDYTLDQAFVTFTDASGSWAANCTEPAPLWAACQSAELQARLCTFYTCPSKTVPGINDDQGV
jgi:hypothetical protein